MKEQYGLFAPGEVSDGSTSQRTGFVVPSPQESKEHAFYLTENPWTSDEEQSVSNLEVEGQMTMRSEPKRRSPTVTFTDEPLFSECSDEARINLRAILIGVLKASLLQAPRKSSRSVETNGTRVPEHKLLSVCNPLHIRVNHAWELFISPACLPYVESSFDSTLGYPGEGPPKKSDASAVGTSPQGSKKRPGSRSRSRGPKAKTPVSQGGKRGRGGVVKPKPKIDVAAARRFLEEKEQFEALKNLFPPLTLNCITCSKTEVITTQRQVNDVERYQQRGGSLPTYDLCGTCVKAKAIAKRLRLANEEKLKRDMDIIHTAPSARAAVLEEKRVARAAAADVVARLGEEAEDEAEMKEFRRLLVDRSSFGDPQPGHRVEPSAPPDDSLKPPESVAVEEVPADVHSEAEDSDDCPGSDGLEVKEKEEKVAGGVEAKEPVEPGAPEVKGTPVFPVDEFHVDWDKGMSALAPAPEGTGKCVEKSPEPLLPPPVSVPNSVKKPKAKTAEPPADGPVEGRASTKTPEGPSRREIEMELRKDYVMLDYTPYDMSGHYRPVEQNTTLMNLKVKLINNTSAFKKFSDDCLFMGIKRGRIAVPRSMLASIKLKYAQFDFKKAASEADHEMNYKQLRHNAGQWFQRAFFDYTGVQVAGGDVGARVTPHFFQQNDPQPVGLNEWALFAMAAVIEHMIVTHTKAVSDMVHVQRTQLREVERSVQYQNPYTTASMLCECAVATVAVLGCCVGAALSPVVVGLGHAIDQFVEPGDENVVETVFQPMRKIFNSRLLETRTSRKRQRLENYIASRPPSEPIPALRDFEPDKKGAGMRICEGVATLSIAGGHDGPPTKKSRIIREPTHLVPVLEGQMVFPPPQKH